MPNVLIIFCLQLRLYGPVIHKLWTLIEKKRLDNARQSQMCGHIILFEEEKKAFLKSRYNLASLHASD